MDDLSKTEQLSLRVSARQQEWLAEAAKIVSLQRGAAVADGTLAVELISEGSKAIIARHREAA